MILYYAMGGGLGHLTRARAVLRTLSIEERVVILTSSPFARDRRVVGEADVILAPEALAEDMAGYRRWLRSLLERHKPSQIYLDTFPAGILGELCDFPFPVRTRIVYIARLLRWQEYAKRLCGSPPPIELAYRVEPLTQDHEDSLRTHGIEAKPLVLKGTTQSPSYEAKQHVRGLIDEDQPAWIIVHSGPDEEILDLVSYASEMSRIEQADPRLVLIAPRRPEGLRHDIVHLDLYPACSIYPLADRIITACGFNAMRETEPYREKHRFHPFRRRFDDQFSRASRRSQSISRSSRAGSSPLSLRV